MVDDIVSSSRVYEAVEVRGGPGRRRRWTAEQKGRIVGESFAPGARVSEVARTHGLTPQHLFLWRKAAKDGRLVLPLEEGVPFAPVLLETPGRGGGLELEVGGAVIRVSAETDMALLVAVVAALQAAR
jgi:transposase